MIYVRVIMIKNMHQNPSFYRNLYSIAQARAHIKLDMTNSYEC